MKKFLGILAAVMVAVISVFNLSGNIKNAAEPQYFLENTQVKNAIVDLNGEVKLFFDNSSTFTPSSTNYTDPTTLFYFTSSEVYYYNEQNEIIDISSDILTQLGIETFNNCQFNFNWNQNFKGFTIFDVDNGEEYEVIKYKDNGFYYSNSNNLANALYIMGTNNIDTQTLNEKLVKYIGNLTSLPGEEPTEPTVPLTQIGSIITDTIGWFTNIFTGLSAAFYIDGALTTWGTVLFIGVAITLIAMCLKWLISLIKGV